MPRARYQSIEELQEELLSAEERRQWLTGGGAQAQPPTQAQSAGPTDLPPPDRTAAPQTQTRPPQWEPQNLPPNLRGSGAEQLMPSELPYVDDLGRQILAPLRAPSAWIGERLDYLRTGDRIEPVWPKLVMPGQEPTMTGRDVVTPSLGGTGDFDLVDMLLSPYHYGRIGVSGAYGALRRAVAGDLTGAGGELLKTIGDEARFWQQHTAFAAGLGADLLLDPVTWTIPLEYGARLGAETAIKLLPRAVERPGALVEELAGPVLRGQFQSRLVRNLEDVLSTHAPADIMRSHSGALDAAGAAIDDAMGLVRGLDAESQSIIRAEVFNGLGHEWGAAWRYRLGRAGGPLDLRLTGRGYRPVTAGVGRDPLLSLQARDAMGEVAGARYTSRIETARSNWAARAGSKPPTEQQIGEYVRQIWSDVQRGRPTTSGATYAQSLPDLMALELKYWRPTEEARVGTLLPGIGQSPVTGGQPTDLGYLEGFLPDAARIAREEIGARLPSSVQRTLEEADRILRRPAVRISQRLAELTTPETPGREIMDPLAQTLVRGRAARTARAITSLEAQEIELRELIRRGTAESIRLGAEAAGVPFSMEGEALAPPEVQPPSRHPEADRIAAERLAQGPSIAPQEPPGAPATTEVAPTPTETPAAAPGAVQPQTTEQQPEPVAPAQPTGLSIMDTLAAAYPQPMHIDTVVAATGIPIGPASAELMVAMLEGRVKQVGPQRYVLTHEPSGMAERRAREAATEAAAQAQQAETVARVTAQTPQQQSIVDAITAAGGRANTDDISEAMGVPVHQLNADLMLMEIAGTVKRQPGNFYALGEAAPAKESQEVSGEVTESQEVSEPATEAAPAAPQEEAPAAIAEAWNRTREAQAAGDMDRFWAELDGAQGLENQDIEQRQIEAVSPSEALNELVARFGARFSELPEGVHPERMGWFASPHTEFSIAEIEPREAQDMLLRLGRAGLLEPHPHIGVMLKKSDRGVRPDLPSLSTGTMVHALVEALRSEPDFGATWTDVYDRGTFWHYVASGAPPYAPWRPTEEAPAEAAPEKERDYVQEIRDLGRQQIDLMYRSDELEGQLDEMIRSFKPIKRYTGQSDADLGSARGELVMYMPDGRWYRFAKSAGRSPTEDDMQAMRDIVAQRDEVESQRQRLTEQVTALQDEAWAKGIDARSESARRAQLEDQARAAEESAASDRALDRASREFGGRMTRMSDFQEASGSILENGLRVAARPLSDYAQALGYRVVRRTPSERDPWVLVPSTPDEQEAARMRWPTHYDAALRVDELKWIYDAAKPDTEGAAKALGMGEDATYVERLLSSEIAEDLGFRMGDERSEAPFGRKIIYPVNPRWPTAEQARLQASLFDAAWAEAPAPTAPPAEAPAGVQRTGSLSPQQTAALEARMEQMYDAAEALRNPQVRSVDDPMNALIAEARGELINMVLAGQVSMQEAIGSLTERLTPRIEEWNAAQSQRPAMRRGHPGPTGHHGYVAPDALVNALELERQIIESTLRSQAAPPAAAVSAPEAPSGVEAQPSPAEAPAGAQRVAPPEADPPQQPAPSRRPLVPPEAEPTTRAEQSPADWRWRADHAREYLDTLVHDYNEVTERLEAARIRQEALEDWAEDQSANMVAAARQAVLAEKTGSIRRRIDSLMAWMESVSYWPGWTAERSHKMRTAIDRAEDVKSRYRERGVRLFSTFRKPEQRFIALLIGQMAPHRLREAMDLGDVVLPKGEEVAVPQSDLVRAVYRFLGVDPTPEQLAAGPEGLPTRGRQIWQAAARGLDFMYEAYYGRTRDGRDLYSIPSVKDLSERLAELSGEEKMAVKFMEGYWPKPRAVTSVPEYLMVYFGIMDAQGVPREVSEGIVAEIQMLNERESIQYRATYESNALRLADAAHKLSRGEDINPDDLALLVNLDPIFDMTAYAAQVSRISLLHDIYHFVIDEFPTTEQVIAEAGEAGVAKLQAAGYRPLTIAGQPLPGLEDRLMAPQYAKVLEARLMGQLGVQAILGEQWSNAWKMVARETWSTAQVAVLLTHRFLTSQVLEYITRLLLNGVNIVSPNHARYLHIAGGVLSRALIEEADMVPARPLSFKRTAFTTLGLGLLGYGAGSMIGPGAGEVLGTIGAAAGAMAPFAMRARVAMARAHEAVSRRLHQDGVTDAKIDQYFREAVEDRLVVAGFGVQSTEQLVSLFRHLPLSTEDIAVLIAQRALLGKRATRAASEIGHDLGLAQAELRDLTEAVAELFFGIDNLHGLVAYIARRERGETREQARKGVRENRVELSVGGGDPIGDFLKHILWFSTFWWQTGRTLARAATRRPGWALTIAEMWRRRHEFNGFDAEAQQIFGGMESWRLTSPEWAAIPWRNYMLPPGSAPGPLILKHMGPAVAFVRLRIPFVEEPGVWAELAIDPVRWITGNLVPGARMLTEASQSYGMKDIGNATPVIGTYVSGSRRVPGSPLDLNSPWAKAARGQQVSNDELFRYVEPQRTAAEAERIAQLPGDQRETAWADFRRRRQCPRECHANRSLWQKQPQEAAALELQLMRMYYNLHLAQTTTGLTFDVEFTREELQRMNLNQLYRGQAEARAKMEDGVRPYIMPDGDYPYTYQGEIDQRLLPRPKGPVTPADQVGLLWTRMRFSKPAAWAGAPEE